jgi:hypothetical protein
VSEALGTARSVNVVCTVTTACDAGRTAYGRAFTATLDTMRMPGAHVQLNVGPYSFDPPRYLQDNALTQVDSRIFEGLTNLMELYVVG